MLNFAQESRYISNLMTTASIREKEKDRAYDRKLLKERKLEDAEFGDKAKFMTSAYKQKLVEDQKWEKDDRFVQLARMVYCLFSQCQDLLNTEF